MTYVLIKLYGGLIDDVVFFKDGRSAVMELAEFVKVMNVENDDASVVLTAYDDAGATVANEVVTINPYGKINQLVTNLFAEEDISAATYIGFRSDKALVGMQINGSMDYQMVDGLPCQ